MSPYIAIEHKLESDRFQLKNERYYRKGFDSIESFKAAAGQRLRKVDLDKICYFILEYTRILKREDFVNLIKNMNYHELWSMEEHDIDQCDIYINIIFVSDY